MSGTITITTFRGFEVYKNKFTDDIRCRQLLKTFIRDYKQQLESQHYFLTIKFNDNEPPEILPRVI